MPRPLSSLLVFACVLVIAGLAQAQDLPWVLLHDGKPVARFVEHRDNAAACSQARFTQGRTNEGDAWRCAVDAQAQGAAGMVVEPGTGDLGASVVIHSKHTNPPRYPPQAARDGISGTVVVVAHVRIDGSVERIEVATSSGNEELDAAAASAAARWVYRPAMVGGRPAAGTVSIPQRFTLD